MGVAPPCTLVLLIVCKRRSLPWLPPPSRSRLLLPQKENTLSGSEDPSWLPSPPSNRRGSPSKSTTSAAHPLSTENASRLFIYCCLFSTCYTCCLMQFLSFFKHSKKSTSC